MELNKEAHDERGRKQAVKMLRALSVVQLGLSIGLIVTGSLAKDQSDESYDDDGVKVDMNPYYIGGFTGGCTLLVSTLLTCSIHLMTPDFRSSKQEIGCAIFLNNCCYMVTIVGIFPGIVLVIIQNQRFCIGDEEERRFSSFCDRITNVDEVISTTRILLTLLVIALATVIVGFVILAKHGSYYGVVYHTHGTRAHLVIPQAVTNVTATAHVQGPQHHVYPTVTVQQPGVQLTTYTPYPTAVVGPPAPPIHSFTLPNQPTQSHPHPHPQSYQPQPQPQQPIFNTPFQQPPQNPAPFSQPSTPHTNQHIANIRSPQNGKQPLGSYETHGGPNGPFKPANHTTQYRQQTAPSMEPIQSPTGYREASGFGHVTNEGMGHSSAFNPPTILPPSYEEPSGLGTPFNQPMGMQPLPMGHPGQFANPPMMNAPPSYDETMGGANSYSGASPQLPTKKF